MTITIDPGVLATFQPAGRVPLELRVAVQDFLLEEAELLDSRRFDVHADRLLIARRRVLIDQTILGTKNLAIFL